MDQKKIGLFLKELRKQKGLTQEQFAEITGVSNRTVSRWENGNNLPDLDILIEISDYYQVDLQELLDGERRNETMEKEMEETVLKAVDYTNTEAEHYNRRVHWLLLAGAVLWFLSQLIAHTDLYGDAVFRAISEFCSGAATGMLFCGILVTGRFGRKLHAFKQRLRKRG